MGLHLEHVPDQAAETVSSLRLLTEAQQVPGSLGQILPASQELRQGSQSRAPCLPQLAPLAEPLCSESQLLGGPLVAIQRLAKQPHQAVAFGQEIPNPLLERMLLAIGLGRFALLDLEQLVGAAQATVDLRATILQRGQAILGAGDPRQHLHQRRALRFPLAIDPAEGLLGDLGLGLCGRLRLRLAGEGLLHGPKLVAEALHLFLGNQQLAAQTFQLPFPGQLGLVERGALPAFVFDLALRLLDLAAQLVERLAALAEDALPLGEIDALGLESGVALGEVGLRCGGGIADAGETAARALDLRQKLPTLVHRQGELEHALDLAQLLVPGRLAGLALDGGDLPLDLPQHVGDPNQVLLGRLELPLRFAAPRLVLADPSGFLDEYPALLGVSRDDLGDPPLLDDGVALGADAGVSEEIVHVAETTGHLVHQVLGLPGPIQAPGNLDLGEGGELGRAAPIGVVEGEDDLAQPHRRPRLGAGEDDVFHALSAQATGRLLSHGPANGIDDIRLPAAVRAHDGGDPRPEAERRLVDEALEPRDLQRLDPQPNLYPLWASGGSIRRRGTGGERKSIGSRMGGV